MQQAGGEVIKEVIKGPAFLFAVYEVILMQTRRVIRNNEPYRKSKSYYDSETKSTKSGYKQNKNEAERIKVQ